MPRNSGFSNHFPAP